MNRTAIQRICLGAAPIGVGAVLLVSSPGGAGAQSTVVVENNSSRIVYEKGVEHPKRWDQAEGGQWAGASQGNIHFSFDADAKAELDFESPAVTYVYWVGPDGGRAEVKVDNEITVIDQCATVESFQVRRTFNTGSGRHQILVRNTGPSSPNCGTRLTVDAFILEPELVPPTPEIVSTGRYEEGDRGVQFVGIWDGLQQPQASGGGMRISNHKGSFVSLFFHGQSISFFYQVGPLGGIANVELDGALLDTIDTYSPDTMWQRARYYNVSNTSHTLIIRVTDTRNPLSGGTRIAFDSLVVSGDQITPTAIPTQTPVPTATAVPPATPVPVPSLPPAPAEAIVPPVVQPPTSPPPAFVATPSLEDLLSELKEILAAIAARLDALEQRLESLVAE